ncbi:MAG: hypothetical protein HOP12_13635 [Candidatus Eisenbacteria bacterium]|uniref:Glycosyltransferase RgtA/B/C/D-like domain-containing protein n=1 Tax=Eiseniibacteriota bacterium TaxID=2212470 RepID=A0A849SN11_UNCEI|nr:hypothetical protein [Candidatus Eisenbacteria bacterium]
MIQSTSQPIQPVERAGLVLGLVLAGVLMWFVRGYITDDTFIHLQYARNLATGHGLVFNVGERVYGCTSPLWVTLLADAMLLRIDGLWFSKMAGYAATLASVGLFLQLMRRTVTNPVVRAAATVAWASHAWMIRWAMSGMETPLAVALTLAGFVAFTEGRQWGSRPVRTGTLWSLAALTRPEAGLLLLFWGSFLLIDTDTRESLRRFVAGVLPPTLIYGAWLVFARFYFGTFWPQTLAAKAAGSGDPQFVLDNLGRTLKLIAATDGAYLVILALGLVFAFKLVFAARPANAQRFLPWCWVIGLPMLYNLRGVPVLSRYALPILPVLAWLAWRVVDRWWVGDAEASSARRRTGQVLACALALGVTVQNLVVYREKVVPQVQSFSPALRTSLIRWGRWFGAYTPPGTVIAAPDIGALGYYSQRRVIDLAGLVTPEMIPALVRAPMEDAVASFAFAAFSRPDYLMDRDPEAYGLLRRSPYARALTPLGVAAIPNLGIARPTPAVYSVYRIDWAVFDSLRAARVAREEVQ